MNLIASMSLTVTLVDVLSAAYMSSSKPPSDRLSSSVTFTPLRFYLCCLAKPWLCVCATADRVVSVSKDSSNGQVSTWAGCENYLNAVNTMRARCCFFSARCSANICSWDNSGLSSHGLSVAPKRISLHLSCLCVYILGSGAILGSHFRRPEGNDVCALCPCPRSAVNGFPAVFLWERERRTHRHMEIAPAGSTLCSVLWSKESSWSEVTPGWNPLCSKNGMLLCSRYYILGRTASFCEEGKKRQFNSQRCSE